MNTEDGSLLLIKAAVLYVSTLNLQRNWFNRFIEKIDKNICFGTSAILSTGGACSLISPL